MKLTVKTDVFQNMVAKAVKGSSNSNLYLTQLMAISLKNNDLVLITTDENNYLYVKEPKVAGDDFYAVVPVEKFAKLISRLTCEEITLEIPQSKSGELEKLIVKGNGKYVIELPYDEDGQLVQFPDPLASSIPDAVEEDVKLSTIHLILSTAKAALQVAKNRTCYCGYYIGDRVVTTDSYKICGIDIKLFDRAMLLPPELVDLLDLLGEEDVKVTHNDDTLIFSTDRTVVYGHVMEGIDEYKIDAISSLLDEQFGSSCKIEKSALLQLLDRLTLFVGTYDKNSVYLTFTKDGLLVSSKQDSGSEIIPYRESNNFKDYTCCLDIELFKSQVKANQSGVIEILYGNDSSIKMVDANVKQIVALADDDREDSDEEDAE